MLAAGFRATTDASVLDDAAAAVVCVPTPLGTEGGPDLGAVRSAMTAVAEHLHPGQLVVLESTTYPGTTQDVVRPLLEEASGLTAGEDFHLAFSPERIDPGNAEYGLANTPKVVGGLTPACTAQASAFYGKFVHTIVEAAGHARGRDREAAGEHLPAHQHRAGQRDGAVLPRARHRPVGRDPLRVDQAVRLPGVLPRPGRRRPLHPDRPELPLPQRAGQARLPVPVRGAGRGDQRDRCRRTSPTARRTCSTSTARRSTARRCCCSA